MDLERYWTSTLLKYSSHGEQVIIVRKADRPKRLRYGQQPVSLGLLPVADRIEIHVIPNEFKYQIIEM